MNRNRKGSGLKLQSRGRVRSTQPSPFMLIKAKGRQPSLPNKPGSRSPSGEKSANLNLSKTQAFRSGEIKFSFDMRFRRGSSCQNPDAPSRSIGYPNYCPYHRMISHPISDCFASSSRIGWRINIKVENSLSPTKFSFIQRQRQPMSSRPPPYRQRREKRGKRPRMMRSGRPHCPERQRRCSSSLKGSPAYL